MKCDKCGKELDNFEKVSSVQIDIKYPIFSNGKVRNIKMLRFKTGSLCAYCIKELQDKKYKTESEFRNKVIDFAKNIIAIGESNE